MTNMSRVVLPGSGDLYEKVIMYRPKEERQMFVFVLRFITPTCRAHIFKRPQRTSREERDHLAAQLEQHYMSGTSYAQSASGTVYLLATVLERVDTDLLWCVRQYARISGHSPFHHQASHPRSNLSIYHLTNITS
jgi:hypothetical protein